MASANIIAELIQQSEDWAAFLAAREALRAAEHDETATAKALQDAEDEYACALDAVREQAWYGNAGLNIDAIGRDPRAAAWARVQQLLGI